MTTHEMLLQIIEGQKQITSEISDLKEGQKQTNERLDKIEDDIAELKYDSEVTRAATNKLVENFEDLVKVLNDTNTVYFKVH